MEDVTPTTMYAAEWCTLTERCTGATRTVDFAENGSVISNLPEEGKQTVHTLILSLYYALSADTVATELPLLFAWHWVVNGNFFDLKTVLKRS